MFLTLYSLKKHQLYLGFSYLGLQVDEQLEE